MCIAYPEVEQLLTSTQSLWRVVHLPFPDPLLYHYPGWRRCEITTPTHESHAISLFTNQHISQNENHNTLNYSDNSNHDRERFNSTTRSVKSVLDDERYHFLREPDYFDLTDIEGGEHDNHDENTSWIILDVLSRIPLSHVRHLIFDSPPCHLCVNPCNRTCECECHQNDLGHTNQPYPRRHQPSAEYENSLHILGSFNNSNSEPLPQLSQPLYNLFNSGLVDFSRHLDLRSLNEILVTDITSNNDDSSHEIDNAVSYPAGINNLSYPFHEIHNSVKSEYQLGENQNDQVDGSEEHAGTLDQLDIQDALLELIHPEDEEQTIEHVGSTGDDRHSDREALEQLRQYSETRAAYQRARLLVRILSLNGLETLETLIAPWWPAARIYTIRQQLERWSFMIEQAQSSATTSTQESEFVEYINKNELPSASHETVSQESSGVQSTFAPWHTRWSNGIDSSISESTQTRDGSMKTFSSQIKQAPVSVSFPLPSLLRFTLRSGGEVVSHERHSIGESAMILSGHSSAASSLSVTPPHIPDPTTLHGMLHTSAAILPLSKRPVFKYCHHCGSQYLSDSNVNKTCFCYSSFPTPL
ncbi:hypothetical protein BGZ76_010213 [Entomortierella beljakovae]|nr:hypothetical protein BGZ76_010213 [Entomortierella beljakovae]